MSFFALRSVRLTLGHSRWLWLVMVFAVFEAVLQSVLPTLLRQIIDTALGVRAHIPQSDIAGMIVIYAGIAASIPFINWMMNIVASWNAWSATNALRDTVGMHVFAQPLEFFRSHGIGELSERIDADPAQLHQILGMSSANLVRMLVLLGGVGYGAWLIRPEMSIILMGYAILGTLGLVWAQRNNADDWEAERVADAALYDTVEESFASVTDMRAVGGETALSARLTPRLDKLLHVHRFARMRSERATVAAGVIKLSGWVLALAGGSWWVIQAQGTLGEAVALLGFVALLGVPIEHVRNEIQALQQALGAFRRIEELLGSTQTLPTDIPPAPQTCHIQVNEVFFRYPSSNDWVIRGIDLHITHGTHVALLGRTGSGKSTLMRLISGLEAPQQGHITLAGMEMADLPEAYIRRWIGVISQEVDIFNATLRDNLTCFADDYHDEQVWQAIHDMQLTDWVRSFAQGLDTMLGDGERTLSPGEEQLIAFVRLQLRNPRVVLLDEASAHIDPLNEQRINQAMRVIGAGRTILTIAHRLSTVKTADRIIVMADGMIIEDGTAQTLSQRIDGVYAQLLATTRQHHGEEA